MGLFCTSESVLGRGRFDPVDPWKHNGTCRNLSRLLQIGNSPDSSRANSSHPYLIDIEPMFAQHQNHETDMLKSHRCRSSIRNSTPTKCRPKNNVGPISLCYQGLTDVVIREDVIVPPGIESRIFLFRGTLTVTMH
ncbi:Uncharacterised protein at_DN2600 [Pycnogonum litorale]